MKKKSFPNSFFNFLIEIHFQTSSKQTRFQKQKKNLNLKSLES